MIQIEKVSKRFRKREAIKYLSCDLDQGCYGILGPNGAGKTTLLRCILGLYKLDSGKIHIPDDTMIGYLPQKFGMFQELKVIDMMDYFAVAKKIPKSERKQEIMRVLDQVNLSDRIRDKVGQLSGGMQRRIGIAQALLGDPEVILFDEPTAGLDPEERSRYKKIIYKLRDNNKCIVISTHIVEDVESVCNRVIMMKKGRIIENVSLDEAIAFSGENKGTLEQGYLSRLNKECE